MPIGDDGAAGPVLARLLSLDPERGGRSFHFRGLRREVVARELAEVVPAVREVERAAQAGLHAAGFLAYEAAPAFEPRLATPRPRPGLPLAWFGLFAERAEVDPLAEPEPGAAGGEPFSLGPLRPSVSPEEYEAAVRRILEWIAAGDSYQVNHTFRLRGSFAGSEEALFRRLVEAQRSAFCAHLRFGRWSVLSASPELFFRWRAGRLELRPMKGTRPRGRWSAEDRERAAELLASDKERAENLMIVDLLRNDAGRIARFGTVRVPELFVAERYPTVHQLTSTVVAETRPGTTLEEVLRALFPSGSVTGAPKIRTSEIIAGLEDSPRGVYTGAIGFVSPDEAAFSVAIRTLVLDREAGEVELGVGSGITADSDPAAEHRECWSKAAFVHHSPAPFRLLETLRHDAAEGIALLDAHLERLADSADYFGFRLDPSEARARLARLADTLPPGPHLLRLLLDRDGTIAVEHAPLPRSPDPVRVGVAPEPVDERDPLLFHKTTRRGVYARRAAQRPDCDDVLMVNRRGELTESTIASLVVRLDGALLTPPLEAGLLPGTMRALLLRRGEIHERTLRPEDLPRAREIWLVSSVRGWRRAVLVGERPAAD